MATPVSSESNDGIPRVRKGPLAWLSSSMRIEIERAISTYLRSEWKIRIEEDYCEFACHRCALVSDGTLVVFFKLSEAKDAIRQFELEMDGLKVLHAKTGVKVPSVIEIVTIDTGSIMIMEALQAIPRETDQWLDMGRTLAKIHSFHAESFGFERDGFWGPLHQDNTPALEWDVFFRDRRLLPLLEFAISSGNLTVALAENVESIASRISELCGPVVSPVLLHGDAQQNNFLSTSSGTYVIDPAVYYGHAEMDLASIDSFQPVPPQFFKGYREVLPIDPGFENRRELWRIPLYLAAVALEGAYHLPKLKNAIDCYR